MAGKVKQEGEIREINLRQAFVSKVRHCGNIIKQTTQSRPEYSCTEGIIGSHQQFVLKRISNIGILEDIVDLSTNDLKPHSMKLTGFYAQNASSFQAHNSNLETRSVKVLKRNNGESIFHPENNYLLEKDSACLFISGLTGTLKTPLPESR